MSVEPLSQLLVKEKLSWRVGRVVLPKPPRLVRTLMRHADIRTTERYYLMKNAQPDAGKIRNILGGGKKRRGEGVCVT